MVTHRKKANKKRASLGLRPFAWGPKVQGSFHSQFFFDIHDSLQSHPSDNDRGNGLVLRGRCFYLDYEGSHAAGPPKSHISPSIACTHMRMIH